jgi:hypothetical protein
MTHHWKENFKKFVVACGKSDITPAMVTTSTTIDITVKW